MVKLIDYIKDGLSLDVDDSAFDTEIIIHIGGAVLQLHQVGVCENISYTSDMDIDDIISESIKNIPEKEIVRHSILNYILLYVKMLFDPPTSSTQNAFKARMDELIWRLEAEYTNNTRGENKNE